MYKAVSILLLFLSATCLSQQQPVLKVNTGHQSFVNSGTFSPDGKYLLSGSTDNMIILWDALSGKEIKTYGGHRLPINAVCFSPDGKYFVSGSDDNTIKLWELFTGKVIKTFNGHTEAVTSVTFSPDGKTILSGSADKTMKLFDIKDGYSTLTADKNGNLVAAEKGIKTYSNHRKIVTSVCFSPNGKFILSGSDDGTIVLMKTSSGSIEHTFTILYNEIKSVFFSPDGNSIIAGGSKGIIKIWDVKSGKERRSFTGATGSITSLCFSPSAKYILSGSSDNTIILWDVSVGERIKTVKVHSGSVNSVAFSPDERFFCSGSDDRSIIIWETQSCEIVHVLQGYNIGIQSMDISADGKLLLTGSGNGNLNIWDVTIGKIIKSIHAHDKPILSVAFSKDNKYILSGSRDQTVKLWDVNTGKEIRTFNGNNKGVNSVCFAPDDKTVVSGGDDKSIKKWDVASGREIISLFGHTDKVNSVCFSSNGRFLISGGADKSLRIWDVNTGKEISSLNEHGMLVTSVCLSSDNKTAISGSLDNSVILWDIYNRKSVKSYFHGENAPVSSVRFSPDNKSFSTLSFDNKLRIWDISQINHPRKIFDLKTKSKSMCYSPDGKTIYVGCLDGSIKVVGVDNFENDIVTCVSDGKKWLVFSNDMYFDCSSGGGDFLAMVLDNRGFNIDQFALKNNRPDIILQRLGNTDSPVIQHYFNQYKKRLRKSGFAEEQVTSEIHVPTAVILEKRTEGKFLFINFKLTDDKYYLKRFNIYVNDVPLFGAYGKDISGKNNQALSERIELTNGTNKIEISCTNEKGAESFRSLTYAECKEKPKGDLYFLAFGVSEYKDATLNLQYADKDARDLSETLKKMEGAGFNKVYVKTCLNEAVTSDAIKSSKSFINSARVDDTFVLYIAGHGIHDNDAEATYYYITYNTDRNNLKGTAASFDLVEDLLQGVAPRNKLFLMDACESGELDDEMGASYMATANSRGLNSRGFKTADKALTANNKQQYFYLLDKDRYIYNDLTRRSGAIVFSSSKGNEFSYEHVNIQNGLFTESLIKAFAQADRNNDGIVSTDELRSYVMADVSGASGELQHPTVDRDNIYQKFGFPVVK